MPRAPLINHSLRTALYACPTCVGVGQEECPCLCQSAVTGDGSKPPALKGTIAMPKALGRADGSFNICGCLRCNATTVPDPNNERGIWIDRSSPLHRLLRLNDAARQSTCHQRLRSPSRATTMPDPNYESRLRTPALPSCEERHVRTDNKHNVPLQNIMRMYHGAQTTPVL